MADPAYHFTPKSHWCFKNNLLTGITLPAWLRMLWRHGARIDWFLYWQRAAFLTAMSALQSLLGLADSLLYGRAIASQMLHPEPVFVLGHPRTGTTHVHNLLAQDPRFGTPTVFHCGFPSAFLWLQRYSWLFSSVLDATRPMDNMALHFGLPCEDELATNVLSAGVSPYMPITFMRDHRSFRPLYTFEAASPAQLGAWRAAFMWFLRKVTLQCGGKPLVIKSPVHTARVALLLKLFPRAKFVYCHRDPLQIFQSAAHMADTYYWQCYLQQPSDGQVTDFILEQGELLHAAYVRDRPLIPKGNLIEVPFAELDSDPVGTMRRLYAAFGWEREFTSMEPVYRRYVDSLEGFKKNDHRRLPRALAARVVERWRPAFEEFGYSAELVPAEDGAPERESL